VTKITFTVWVVAIGLMAASPGFLMALAMHQGVHFAWFMLTTATSCCVAAHLMYPRANARSQRKKLPWPQCVGLVGLAYLFFGLLMAIVVIGSKSRVALDWQLVRGLLATWAVFSGLAVVMTGWLSVPASIFIAWQMMRSNKRVQATRKTRAPDA
jgi:hypothetical protein